MAYRSNSGLIYEVRVRYAYVRRFNRQLLSAVVWHELYPLDRANCENATHLLNLMKFNRGNTRTDEIRHFARLALSLWAYAL